MAALVQSKASEFTDTLTFTTPPLAGSLLIIGSTWRDGMNFTAHPSGFAQSAAGVIGCAGNARGGVLGYKWTTGGGADSGPLQDNWNGGVGGGKTTVWIAEFSGLAIGQTPVIAFLANQANANNWRPGPVTLTGPGLLVTLTDSDGSFGPQTPIEGSSVLDVSKAHNNSEEPRTNGLHRIVATAGSYECSCNSSSAMQWAGITLGFLDGGGVAPFDSGLSSVW